MQGHDTGCEDAGGDNDHLRGVLGILDIRVVRLGERLYVRSYRYIFVPLNGMLHVVLCLGETRFN